MDLKGDYDYYKGNCVKSYLRVMRKRLGLKREPRVVAAARLIYQDETRCQLLCLDH